MTNSTIRALTFDVFGTVVDWRTSVAREGETMARRLDIRGVDWTRFAMDWRALYQPAMERIRNGSEPFTKLDVLHRANLEQVLARHGIDNLREDELEHLNNAWHRLDPWPDASAALRRLRQRFVLATLSNGNVALMVDLARHADLCWDTILGAEVARAYKPQPVVYESAVEMLGLNTGEVLMVAAHNDDLEAAMRCGLRTAFVARPREYGPDQQKDLCPARDDYDFCARDLHDLADQLGC